MGGTLRLSPAQWDAIERRMQPPIVGVANANDRPSLPPRKRPRAHGKRAARPYFQALCALLRLQGIAEPNPEFRFDSDRLWRFDFAWPAHKLAIEIDGGLWVDGAHNRGAALLKQYEKSNAATLAGWRVLRYAPDQLAQAAHDVALALRP